MTLKERREALSRKRRTLPVFGGPAKGATLELKPYQRRVVLSGVVGVLRKELLPRALGMETPKVVDHKYEPDGCGRFRAIVYRGHVPA